MIMVMICCISFITTKLEQCHKRMPFFDAVLKEVLEENNTLTLLARAKNKELMGLIMISSKTTRCVRIFHNWILFYDISSSSSALVEDSPPPKLPIYAQMPAKFSKIMTLLKIMKKEMNIPRDYKVNTWSDVDFLVCRSDTRIPGLGTQLCKTALAILQQRGVQV